MTKRFMLTAAGMALCAGSISAIQVNDKFNPTDAERDAMDHLESRDSDYIEERSFTRGFSSDSVPGVCCLPGGGCTLCWWDTTIEDDSDCQDDCENNNGGEWNPWNYLTGFD